MPNRSAQLTQLTVKPKVYYRDFAPGFGLQANTGEIQVLVNEASVMNSIKNLVLTYPGERYYQPNVGSVIGRSLFEFADIYQLDLIKDTILNCISAYEPRATNVQVQVTTNPQTNDVYVQIQFQLVNFSQIFSVPVIVIRAR